MLQGFLALLHMYILIDSILVCLHTFDGLLDNGVHKRMNFAHIAVHAVVKDLEQRPQDSTA